MLLEHDDKYTPCTVDNNDEFFVNGIFVFNITKLTEYLHRNKQPIVPITIDDFHRSHSVLNHSHVDSVDIDKPIIVAEISPSRYNLIDGNHRAEKARKLGLQQLPGYRLSMTEHLAFLTTRTGYDAYVDYWNDKISNQ